MLILFSTNPFSSALEPILLISYLLGGMLLKNNLPRLHFYFKQLIPNFKKSDIANSIPLLAVLFLWFLSFYLWFEGESTIWALNNSISEIGFVPWYVYPVRLGVPGLFSVLALLISSRVKAAQISEKLGKILLIIGVLFILGTLISFMKIFYFPISFWEIRILRYSLSAFAALAGSMLLLYALEIAKTSIKNTRSMHFKWLTKLLATLLISIIFIAGAMSTLFALDYSFSQPRRSINSDTSTFVNSI